MGLVMSFMGGGSLYSQMLDYLSGKVYNEFVAKNISTPDDFQVAILDIFNTLNTGLPGKHYDVPPRDEVKEFFYNVWNKASSEDKRTKFVKFIAMHVKPNKIDRATMITGIVTPPIAMAAKRSGENVPQLKMIKAVPDALFVPFTTVVALFSVKITRRCCSNLETLNGKAFQELTSLQTLDISGCPRLGCLPEEGLPTSLTRLYIDGCPLLKKQCEREKGEDWPKIQHITKVILDGARIK
ncbi:hypothetical protein CsatB_003213 [Cannabis sativa]